MSTRNRVVWSEGLFIKPHHFQQQQKSLEYLINDRINTVSRYLYGVNEISINLEYLTFGRIALTNTSGVMPDGTTFYIPQEDLLPDALEVPDSSFANQIIYLAVPLRSDSLLEINRNENNTSASRCRYKLKNVDVRDIHSEDGDMSQLDVASVSLKLMFEKEDRSAYASMAIAKVLEKRPDGSVVLDSNFIPCHMAVSAVSSLHRFITEISGLVGERAKNIAMRLGSLEQGGVADVSDFMLLQALNSAQPRLNHLANLRSLHPERLFESLLSICGELSTFTDNSRLPPEIQHYNHDMPTDAFSFLISKLRQSLSIVLEPRAVSLQLQERQYGLSVAPIHDTQLIVDADFILAISAKIPLDELRKQFIQQTKVASAEKIRELVSLQLPGITLNALPVAPRQLPYHAGYIYFQLDKSSEAWAMLSNASGFAFHVAGDFPELDMQFWAIRG